MDKLLGRKFGDLTTLCKVDRERQKDIYWKCLCICGNVKIVGQKYLLSGKITSCGCDKGVWYKLNVPKEIQRKYYGYKARSKKNGLAFELEPIQFYNIINKPCFYCGSNDGKHTIDRLDSKLGYTLKNSVPSCLVCNVAKSNKTLEFFLCWIDKVYHHTCDNSL